jgi:hypothetical protein
MYACTYTHWTGQKFVQIRCIADSNLWVPLKTFYKYKKLALTQYVTSDAFVSIRPNFDLWIGSSHYVDTNVGHKEVTDVGHWVAANVGHQSDYKVGHSNNPTFNTHL